MPALTGEVVHGLEGEPTFEADRYVVYVPAPYAEQARTGGLAEAELLRRLEPGRRALLAARDARERPLVDDKVLADWNGLMIGALARASALLREPRYLAAAERAAGVSADEALRDPAAGTLLHTWRDGRASIPAYLDDYAFLVEGLLELHAATGEPRWLAEAVRLSEEQERRLADADGGGYFSAGADEHLLVRAKTAFDGAVASGNGIAALNAVELARRTGDASHRRRAEATLGAFAAGMTEAPLAHVTLVRALERLRALPESATRTLAKPSAPEQAAAAPSAAEALEEEAYAAVEIEGRLGTSEDEEWKPFRIELDVKKGWHVNATPPGAGLEPVRVSGVIGGVRGVRYPAGAAWDGGAGAVPVYTGRVVIEGEIERKGGGAVSVELAYQACDEARCLPPVARIVRLR